MNAEQLFRVRLNSNSTSRLYLPRRAQLDIEKITGAAPQENGVALEGRRPASRLWLRLAASAPERLAVLPIFGDEERESFFQEPGDRRARASA